MRAKVMIAAAGLVWLCSSFIHAQEGGAAAIVKRRIDLGGAAAASRVLITREAARPIATEARTTEIRAGEYVIQPQVTAAATMVRSSAPTVKAWTLPVEIYGLTQQGRSIHIRPVIEAPGGLHAAGDGFSARVYVGLQDVDNPAEAYDLPSPISLLVGALVDTVDPGQLTVKHTSLPLAEVNVLTANPGDSIEVSVQASGTTEKARVTIPVRRPQLQVRPARARIQGLGLEESAIVVDLVGLANPAGRKITVTSDNIGSINPIQVTLDAQGTASTAIRSVSFGTATIRASSPPLASDNSATIRFTWPFAFLFASILGGAAGGFLKQRQQAPGAIKSRGLVAVLVTGIVTGIVVVTLYAVGVNVLPIHPSAGAGEALVFAVAAAGGYLGLHF